MAPQPDSMLENIFMIRFGTRSTADAPGRSQGLPIAGLAIVSQNIANTAPKSWKAERKPQPEKVMISFGQWLPQASSFSREIAHAHLHPNIAVARKLAVILHRMWIEGSEFKWSSKEAASQPA
jgi:hypothetical protein